MLVASRALLRSTAIRVVRPVVHPTVKVRFFSSPSKIEDLAEALKSSSDVSSILVNSSALISALKTSTPNPPIPPSEHDRDRLLSILHLLAISSRPEDIRCIKDILELHTVLGLQVSSGLYTSVLIRLAKEGRDRQVQNFMLNMPQLPGHSFVSLEQIHIVLELISGKSNVRFLEQFVSNIRRMGQRPTNKTFILLFTALWDILYREHNIPSVSEFTPFIRQYSRQGLKYDLAVENILYNGYLQIGEIGLAAEIQSIYRSITTSSDVKDISLNTNRNGLDRDVRSKLFNSKSYADIEMASSLMQKPCTVVHYSIVLANSIRAGDIQEGLHIYEKSKEAGIIPDSALITPLLRAYGRDGSDDAIDKALTLYRDLANAAPPPSPIWDNPKSLDDHSPGPDSGVFDPLLRMLLKSPNTKYLPVVESLLVEMQSRGFPMNTSSVAAAKILLEMRRTKSYSEALDLYRQHRSHLNEHGYHSILQEYCHLSFAGDLEVPLITQYFGMVNDMRLQRVPITPHVYTIILYHIGLTATKFKYSHYDDSVDRVFLRLVATVRRVHDFLTLDASISPDAILWNQLMNTYQRLDCFGDAFRVWEMMLLTGQYDQVSVNIILDACSRSGNLGMANVILKKLEKVGFNLDLHNWNTWVECLCRNGKFSMAINFACLELKKVGIDPNIETLRIIWKFAKRDGRLHDFKRMKEFLPDLWERLPNEMQNS